MQRFFTLVVLLLFALPVGLSVTGCTTNVSAYCNNAGYGPKTTDIFAVRLPTAQSDTGISLAYGQIGQAGTAVATNCKGSTLSTGAATYGSSDLTHADISPTGSICAGSWNHLSTGGIPDYSICTAPTSSAQVKITASIGGIVSNAVTVYVHPQISAINVTAPTACVPSGTVGPNLAAQTTVFDESGNLIPSQDVSTNVVGNITYTANTPSIVTINNTSVNATAGTALGTNGQVTANQPGGTVITATVAGTGTSSPGTSSAAGYFYTCPPTSISLSLPSSTNTTTSTTGAVTITAGNPQTIAATLESTDPLTQVVTPITPITGAGPDYTSTMPAQVAVTTAGVVSSTLPGTATITGICQPGAATSTTTSSASSASTATGLSCNPTPLNKLGTFGTGLPVTANPIVVNSPGVDNTIIYAASPASQLFTVFDLSLGTSGTPTLLPYQPNSMILDPTGSSLYFGSYRELMIYTASNNALTTADTTVPGVVLAVSPSNNQVVIADQQRSVIYLYTPASTSTGSTASTTASSVISTGGLATHAVYSRDGKNVYITGPTALYVHNIVTGWSQYPLTSANATTSCELDNTGASPFCSPDVTLTVPNVAVFVSGSPVVARSFCPDTTTSPVTYNPLAATVTGDTADHLGSTPDGNHVLGANTTSIFDIEHSPTSDTSQLVAPIGPCPGVNPANAGPLTIATTLRQLALTGITPTQIDQVLTSPDSSRAFITYMGATATGLLPMYTPSTTAGGTGTLQNLQLSTGALAPIAGVFSPDAASFYASTTGDNLIHILSTTSNKDTQTLDPQLTDPNRNIVPAQFLATKPKATT